MHCPQCSFESFSSIGASVRINPDGTRRRLPGIQYCRICGARLRVIGPLPKIKEMVKNLRVQHLTEDVSRALEHTNANVSLETRIKQKAREWPRFRRRKTPAERRESHITKGVVSLFSGTGLTIFLYYLTSALVLKLPPHIVQQIPFEIGPVVQVLWLMGLVPALSGLGHIVAGLLIRQEPQNQLESVSVPPEQVSSETPPRVPDSVTERTTNLL